MMRLVEVSSSKIAIENDAFAVSLLHDFASNVHSNWPMLNITPEDWKEGIEWFIRSCDNYRISELCHGDYPEALCLRLAKEFISTKTSR
jgi:hypothetical protein